MSATATVGVTADRRADEQIKMLTKHGIDCVHGPTLVTRRDDTPDALLAATRTIIDRRPDLVVFTTGMGVRTWLETADDNELGTGLRTALGATTCWARGPKANGALVAAGFQVPWVAPSARYNDVVDALERRGDAAELTIGIQLDGAGAHGLVDPLRALGADIVEVPVYRWALPRDPGPVEALIERCIDGSLDGITFTARPQIENLFELASLAGRHDELVDAMGGMKVFCIGEVCAGGFDDVDGVTPLLPERHRLGALVQLVARHYRGGFLQS